MPPVTKMVFPSRFGMSFAGLKATIFIVMTALMGLDTEMAFCVYKCCTVGAAVEELLAGMMFGDVQINSIIPPRIPRLDFMQIGTSNRSQVRLHSAFQVCRSKSDHAVRIAVARMLIW